MTVEPNGTNGHTRRSQPAIARHAEAADRLGAALCGAVLRHPEWLDDLRELVSFEHMGYRPRRIWLAILNLADKGSSFDAVAVGDAIDDFVTPTEYANADGVPVTLHDARYHGEQLFERWRQFELARIGEQIASSALDAPSSHTIDKLADEAARLALIQKPTPVHLISIGKALEELATLASAPIYPTPYQTLNDAIGFGGLLGTQVYTLAAGTGRGKTSWVAELAAYAAQTVPVIVASWEMKPGYFVARKAAGVLGVHSNAILRGEISMARVLEAMPYGRMFLMHKPKLAELRIAIDRVAQKYGVPPLVIVDYLQKLADEIALEQARPDMRLATSQASATLTDIGERSKCAVLAVSAIGRGKGKALANPRKSRPYDLVEVAKESGAVEYDGAGLIVLTLDDELDGDERIATMTLAKARFGEEIHIEARYNGRRGTWRDLGRVEVEPEEEPSTEEVRIRIAEALRDRPAKNKTDACSRVRANRKTAFFEFEQMIAMGLIIKNPQLPGQGIVLSDTGLSMLRGGL